MGDIVILPTLKRGSSRGDTAILVTLTRGVYNRLSRQSQGWKCKPEEAAAYLIQAAVTPQRRKR